MTPDLPVLRASDAERHQTVDLLREHSLAGRLTLEEFSSRIDTAYRATTREELGELTGDLPAHAPHAQARRRPTRWSVSVMGGLARRGRWRVARKTRALALMGGLALDLRNAELDVEEIEVFALAIMGGVDIVVPEGIEVEVDGFSVMGGRGERLSKAPPLPGTPRIRIRAYGLMGGVSVRSKPREGTR
jgi:hypothetical protein